MIRGNNFLEEDNMTIFERYENLKSKVEKRREEFLNFMEFVEKKTEYLTTPASTKFHLCKSGQISAFFRFFIFVDKYQIPTLN